MELLALNKFRKEFKFTIKKDTFPFDGLTNPAHNYKFDFDVFLPSKGMNLQRGLCWTLLQKQEFIISILKGCPIPKIAVIRQKQFSFDDGVYEVIDGKQRITTYLDFVAGKFPIIYNGEEYYIKDLDENTRNEIEYRCDFRGDLAYSYADSPISDEEKIEWFKQINFLGTPQDIEHLNKLTQCNTVQN